MGVAVGVAVAVGVGASVGLAIAVAVISATTVARTSGGGVEVAVGVAVAVGVRVGVGVGVSEGRAIAIAVISATTVERTSGAVVGLARTWTTGAGSGSTEGWGSPQLRHRASARARATGFHNLVVFTRPLFGYLQRQGQYSTGRVFRLLDEWLVGVLFDLR